MEKKKIEYEFKPYEELEFRDDFMFGHVLLDKSLCHDVLECLLQRKVGELEDISTQKEFRYTEDGKPVRLDLYTRDETTVYDGEMHNRNKKTIESMQLPKRTRFYQSSLDADHMNKGSLYRSLPESKILFVCTFDPFEKGLPKYTFRERCEEDDSLYLNDGTEKIFYNCSYKGEDVPDDLKKLYEYIETGKATDKLTERIEEGVMEARKIAVWRSDYMHERANMMDAREEGREEERENTERERRRADSESRRADKAEARVKELEALLAANR